MKAKRTLPKLKRLQAKIDGTRKKLKISAPKAVLYLQSTGGCDDPSVVVEADGYGGATTSVVEGRFPLEFVVHCSKRFSTEEAALAAATEIVEQGVEPTTVLS
jgi:hypothetical protein